MNVFLSLVSEADAMALGLEQAKNKVELAKLNLESAKQELERVKEAYEEVFARAEEAGLSKSKLKKLVEERIQEMNSLGLVELAAAGGAEKAKKPAKTAKSAKRKSPDEAFDSEVAAEGASEPGLDAMDGEVSAAPDAMA